MQRTQGGKPSTSSVCRVSHEQRRALKKLAGTPRGLTEHLLMAHGFSVEMLSGLVQADLAAVVTEPMREPRGVINMIERIRITDAGRRAIKN
jgi:hypothetical protein